MHAILIAYTESRKCTCTLIFRKKKYVGQGGIYPPLPWMNYEAICLIRPCVEGPDSQNYNFAVDRCCLQDKKTVARPSGELRKGRSHSQQQRHQYHADSNSPAASSSQHSRRVGFKNNVAVYRFDSDGEESAGYSSAVSETSEQLDGRPRRHNRRQSQPQQRSGPPPQDRPAPAALQDAAASWEAARGRSTATDRGAVSPRYTSETVSRTDANHDRHHSAVADSSTVRLRSNSVGSIGRPSPQFTTVTSSLYVSDCEDNAERRLNGSSILRRTLKYNHQPASRDYTAQSQRAPSDEGTVLSCGSVTVQNPLFVDRAHYEYVQVRLHGVLVLCWAYTAV